MIHTERDRLSQFIIGAMNFGDLIDNTQWDLLLRDAGRKDGDWGKAWKDPVLSERNLQNIRLAANHWRFYDQCWESLSRAGMRRIKRYVKLRKAVAA